jgi:Membrane proteins related to metalloendopeptidases
MPPFSVYYPIKPLIVTQAFGIFNPAYERFGFTYHNGIDMALNGDKIAYSMCKGIVIDAGYNDGAGNYLKIRTNDKVAAEGKVGYVCLMYMHGEKLLVKKGQQVFLGTPIMVCDNTGFSTGEHLHVSAFFVNEYGTKEPWGRADSDYCFDWSKYCTRYFAQDAETLLRLLQKLLLLMQKNK